MNCLGLMVAQFNRSHSYPFCFSNKREIKWFDEPLYFHRIIMILFKCTKISNTYVAEETLTTKIVLMSEGQWKYMYSHVIYLNIIKKVTPLLFTLNWDHLNAADLRRLKTTLNHRIFCISLLCLLTYLLLELWLYLVMRTGLDSNVLCRKRSNSFAFWVW